MEQDKDPNVDALMAELKAIVDNEAQDMKGMAQQEAEHIFTQIVKEFSKDSDVCDKQSVLAVVSIVEDRDKMIKDIEENDASYIKSDFVTKDEMLNGVGKGAQCKIVAADMSESKFIEMLNDIESNILLCAWLNPVSLITRLKRNDEILNVFVSAETIVLIRQLANGEQVTRSWGGEPDDRPKASEFEDFDYEFIRLSYKALAEPHMIKAKSQDAFEMMVSAIGDKIQQKMENLGDDE
jgi:hypothetical protein